MYKESFVQLMVRLAFQIHATTFVEPIYKKYGVIFFQNGKRLFFGSKRLNINNLSTVSVTINKFETGCFLKRMGYKVPVGGTFSKHDFDIKHGRGIKDGLRFIKEIGFPVVMKPNNKSQGTLVCKVTDEKEYCKIAKKILKEKGDILLIEKFYANYADYRIVVLDENVISAYQRIPLTVVGNGHSTVLELLEEKKIEFKRIGRPVKEINIDDFRIKMSLKERKRDLKYVPESGERLTLLSNSNLSSGGTALELTDKVADEFKRLAISVTKGMNLTLCGIDVLTNDITKWADDYVILEINSAPGLDNYAYNGDAQKQYVDGLYLKVLKFWETKG